MDRRTASMLMLIGLIGLVCLCFIVLLHQPQADTLSNPSPTTSVLTSHLPTATKSSGCEVNNALPDVLCTPGAVISDATKDKICTPGYAKSVRDVPSSEKNQVYAQYGVTSHPTGEFEVDHLVSLELGGSNDITNLWPEAANPTPGFHQKDKVENYLHSQVCNGDMDLAAAQYQIATNWLAVYQALPTP